MKSPTRPNATRKRSPGVQACLGSLLVFFLLFLQAVSAQAPRPRWSMLPATPPPVAGGKHARVQVNGVTIYYTDHGAAGPGAVPVLLLHGGLANSDYLGAQVLALEVHHRVLTMDSRGHGRSTRDLRPFGYDLMADDVIGLLDVLHIPKADIAGWSDGGIIALDLALRHPDRIRRIFAFAANTRPDGLVPDGDKNPNFAHFIERAGGDYKRLSSTPGEYNAFVTQISHMWESEPNWTDAQLRSITAPVLVADGDHDEVIRREHTEYIARTIPGAGLLLLPNTSHFAFLQDAALFNAALIDFFDK